MKSDLWKFTEAQPAVTAITGNIEKIGVFAGLSPKNARLLCLLGEESISLVRGIIPHFDGVIWTENEKKSFEIKVSLSARVTPEERDGLLDTVGGKNSAYGKGIFGKIAAAIAESAIAANGAPDMPAMVLDHSMSGLSVMQPDYMWAMSTYANTYTEEKTEIRDDGLEKSIIVNLADDCKISVRAGSVEIDIVKDFE
jgi:hypothetical protein